jgi:predicted ester cyclase
MISHQEREMGHPSHTLRAMERAEIERLTRRWFEEVWNERNDATIDELMHPNVIVEGFAPTGDTILGRDIFKQLRKQYFEMFPDIHVEIDRIAVDGEDSITWLTCTGTAHPKEFGLAGLPKRVTFSTVAWAQMKDGQFVAGKNLIDFASVLRELQS